LFFQLNYKSKYHLVDQRGIEPRTEACKATAFPITP
jgi:hypothetical protein